MIDRAKLFAAVRGPVFGGSLKQETVNGVNAILDEWERRKLTDLRWLAYMLATARGEVGVNMLPIYERGGRSYFNKYDAGTKLGRALGNTVPGDGFKFRGRGLVQLTGRANYEKMSKETGVSLVANPDLALQPDIAAKIMFEGMIKGTFTGKKLADYFTPAKTDWINARRIINSTDKAEQFATWARAFHTALVKADDVAIAAPAKPADSSKPIAGATAAGGIVVAGGAAAAVEQGVSALTVMLWIGGLSLVAIAALLIGYRIIKGYWPWTSTGKASPELLPLLPQNSELSSEQVSAALLAVSSEASPAMPLPASSESKKRRKPSAKPSPRTRTQSRKSSSSKRSVAKKSAPKRKSKSKG